MTSNTALAAHTLVAFAMKANGEAAAKSMTGQQTMAAALMTYHSEIATKETATFGAMKDGKRARAEFIASFDKAFVTQRADGKDKQQSNQDAARQNVQRQVQMAAVNKGMDLAIALHHANVGLALFDAKRHVFAVPVERIIPDGCEAFDALAKLAKDNKCVALDDTTYVVFASGKARVEKVRVNVQHFLTLAGARKPKAAKVEVAANGTGAAVPVSSGATNTSTTGGAAAVAVNANPATWSLEKIASEIAKLAVLAQGIMESDKAVPLSAWPTELVNAVTELTILRDDAAALDNKADVARDGVMAMAKIVAAA